MKNKLLFFLAFLCVSSKVKSQITFCYDNVGNRFQQSTGTGCPTAAPRSLVITNAGPDSTANITNQQLTQALYPNPTGGPVSVVFNTPVTEAQVTIVDYLGRQLYNATVSGTNIPLDLSHYNDGVYMIVVRTGGNSYESTVVKE